MIGLTRFFMAGRIFPTRIALKTVPSRIPNSPCMNRNDKITPMIHRPRSTFRISEMTYGKELTGDTPRLEFTEKATPNAMNNNPTQYNRIRINIFIFCLFSLFLVVDNIITYQQNYINIDMSKLIWRIITKF